MALRKLIVTGATGKQGGALISALVAKQDQPFEIYAVTRNKNSGGAQALAKKPNVKVIEGDFKTPEDIFKQVEKPWGLFLVTNPPAHTEEAQGKALATAASQAGISHLVFTSVNRGRNTPTDPTPVPHFISKYNIEKEIENLSASNGSLTYTFLNPVCFMDNMTPDFFGKVFGSVWSMNGPNTKLQMVSTKDIGRIAAEAFLNSSNEEYRNRQLSIAGDDLTPEEAKKIFKEETGEDMPETFWFLGRIVRTLVKELGVMFAWFKSDGYAVDVEGLRKKYPFLKDFRGWLREESQWAKK